jgi:diguanylate cyclase (GGDEF)-like protein
MDSKDVVLEFLDCLNAGTTVEQLLQQAAEFVSRVFRADQCALWAQGANVSTVPASPPFLAISSALHAHVASTNAFVLVNSPAQDVLTAHLKDAVKQVQNPVAAYPIQYQGKHAATLVLGAQMLSQHTELVTLLLTKLTVALGRAQRYQDAQHSAMTDALTGLYNKAYFKESLKNEVARAQRSQKPISLVLFDLDNFKEYNDTYGHPEGDKLLKKLSDVIKASARSLDIAARYGGEEFAIILPETGHEPAFLVAERLRKAVEQQLPATVSVGICTCVNASASPETLLNEADKALYTAKREGKNRARSLLIIDKALGVIDVQQAAGIGKA